MMKVVILAGGKGTRLRPLTYKVPKPLLPVAKKPILEWTIRRLKKNNLKDIVLSVGYKANLIKKHFGNGKKLGVNISYVQETKRLGTAGSLYLVNKHFKPKEPLLVMNGDILTKLDFRKMMAYHKRNKAVLTVGSIPKRFTVKYGTIQTKKNKITGLKEKPIIEMNISAGIYIISPDLLKLIPYRFFDMPSLIEKAVKKRKKVLAYTINELWMAIDRLVDYKEISLHKNKYIK